MAGQLTFNWPTGVSSGVDDFFVAPANEAAVAMLQAPEVWPDGKLALIGPEGCGKSHLIRIFLQDNDAQSWPATDVPAADAVTAGTAVIEDVDQLPAGAEEALFHLHNNLRNTGKRLLLTARTAPGRWDITLPDLASRMQATTVTHIGPPDDSLLYALITKLFADRRITPKPNLVAYLIKRIERSYAAAAQIVDAMDRASLDDGRKINRALAGDLLDKP